MKKRGRGRSRGAGKSFEMSDELHRALQASVAIAPTLSQHIAIALRGLPHEVMSDELHRTLQASVAVAPTRSQRIATVLRGLPPEVLTFLDSDEYEEFMKRVHAAKKLPDHDPRWPAWEWVLDRTPDEVWAIWRYLPDPLKRGKGAPKGTGRVAKDADLFLEVQKRVDAGEKPKTAARNVYSQRGLVGDLDGKANYLARRYREMQRRAK